jgi:hypothetical protein
MSLGGGKPNGFSAHRQSRTNFFAVKMLPRALAAQAQLVVMEAGAVRKRQHEVCKTNHAS